MESQGSVESIKSTEETGVLEWLFSGNASAKLLDFFVTYKDFDYSETDIAELAGVSPRTAFREIPKFESVKLITFTRRVGRAKMYKLNQNSEAAKLLEQLVFKIATTRIDDAVKNVQPLQEKITNMLERARDIKKENVIENTK